MTRVSSAAGQDVVIKVRPNNIGAARVAVTVSNSKATASVELLPSQAVEFARRLLEAASEWVCP